MHRMVRMKEYIPPGDEFRAVWTDGWDADQWDNLVRWDNAIELENQADRFTGPFGIVTKP